MGFILIRILVLVVLMMVYTYYRKFNFKSEEFFSFRKNSNIKIIKPHKMNALSDDISYQIEKGENLVFSYQKNNLTNVEVTTDEIIEITEIIKFEIPKSVNHFCFSDEELSGINAYYNELSTNLSPTKKIYKGTISGKKVNDLVWDIFIDISVVLNPKNNTKKRFKIHKKFNLF